MKNFSHTKQPPNLTKLEEEKYYTFKKYNFIVSNLLREASTKPNTSPVGNQDGRCMRRQSNPFCVHSQPDLLPSTLPANDSNIEVVTQTQIIKLSSAPFFHHKLLPSGHFQIDWSFIFSSSNPFFNSQCTRK